MPADPFARSAAAEAAPFPRRSPLALGVAQVPRLSSRSLTVSVRLYPATSQAPSVCLCFRAAVLGWYLNEGEVVAGIGGIAHAAWCVRRKRSSAACVELLAGTAGAP